MNAKKIVLTLCLLSLITACKKDLYTNLSERDANTMLSILDSRNIQGERSKNKDETFNLLVSPKNFSDATLVLKEHGYPKEPFKNMGELFKKEGIISSPLEEKVRYMYALSQNISETITQIEGVITARVNLVLPKDNAFHEEIAPSSASVFITYHPDFSLEKYKPDIKLIVEKSIEGLTYEQVSVVMIPTQHTQTFEKSNKKKWILFFTFLSIFAGWLFYKKVGNRSENGSQRSKEIIPLDTEEFSDNNIQTT